MRPYVQLTVCPTRDDPYVEIRVSDITPGEYTPLVWEMHFDYLGREADDIPSLPDYLQRIMLQVVGEIGWRLQAGTSNQAPKAPETAPRP